MELETLIKFIEGVADHAETRKVEEWLSTDSGNSLYLNKVRKAWTEMGQLKELSRIDVNKDWAEVEKRISGRPKKIRPGSANRSILISFGKAAAVFIFGVVISGLFFYFTPKTPKDNLSTAGSYELNVPEGQKSDLILPDGTKITLNAGSNLSFPKEFDGETRDVWLEGEAFFEVAKNAARPFHVHTPDINIKVLGTTFNVRAYPDEKLTETTLVEGRVILDAEKSPGKEVSLEPEHKAVFISDKNARIPAGYRSEFRQSLKTNEILISEQINTEAAISWMKGKLIFENEYLDVIAGRLEKYYGVRIIIENERLKKIRYTGTLKKVSIEQTLKALQLTTSFHYETNNNIITLKEGL